MIWVGTEQEIGLLATLCDEAVLSVPEVKADGAPVPSTERVTTRWAMPIHCSVCDAHGLAVMAAVMSPLSQVSEAEWAATHAHTLTASQQRDAVAGLLPGLTPSLAAAVSDHSVSAVYSDLVSAGIIDPQSNP
jgi:hypothetical protein